MYYAVHPLLQMSRQNAPAPAQANGKQRVVFFYIWVCFSPLVTHSVSVTGYNERPGKNCVFTPIPTDVDSDVFNAGEGRRPSKDTITSHAQHGSSQFGERTKRSEALGKKNKAGRGAEHVSSKLSYRIELDKVDVVWGWCFRWDEWCL